MSGRFAAMLAGVAALAMLAMGCGGGDEETLTKAEFVKQGSAICAKRTEQINTDLKAAQEEGAGKDQVGAAFEDAMFSNFQAEVDELRELGAPAGDEAQIEKMLDTVEAGIEEAQSGKNARSASDQLAEGREMAEDYGLEGCVSIF